MDVASILLSEYARIIDGSRLLVVGTFNEIRTPRVPVTVQLFLSLVIEAHRDDRGKEHRGELFVLNGKREELTRLEVPFSFGDKDPKPGMFLKHTHLAAIQIAFPEGGPYSFEFHIDGTYHAATNLYVIAADEP